MKNIANIWITKKKIKREKKNNRNENKIYLNLPGWPCSHSKSLFEVDGRRESDTIIAI